MFWQKWFEPKPFNSGYLPEEDGHLVWFAEFGNPQGIPVLSFHGGPGGSSRAKHAKSVNLKKYRLIMFDQRGAGHSLPLGKIQHNTTQDLLNDATRLLNHLNINQKIILRGASWGSTLALLWAEQYPEKISKILISQVFLANQEFLNWEFDGMRGFYPEIIEQMEKESHGNIRGYYNKLIQSNNLQKQLEATNKYGWYERICGSLTPCFANFTELSEKELASNRIYLHYAANNLFLGDNNILDNIHKIKDIETLIVHNRLDFVCPFKGAWDVHKALPNSRLVIVPEKGHVGKLLSQTIQKEFSGELK